MDSGRALYSAKFAPDCCYSLQGSSRACLVQQSDGLPALRGLAAISSSIPSRRSPFPSVAASVRQGWDRATLYFQMVAGLAKHTVDLASRSTALRSHPSNHSVRHEKDKIR